MTPTDVAEVGGEPEQHHAVDTQQQAQVAGPVARSTSALVEPHESQE